jgi:hypothetical protein
MNDLHNMLAEVAGITAKDRAIATLRKENARLKAALMPKPIFERVTHCADEPEVIDEIAASNVDIHIEQLNDGHYWMRIANRTFHLSTKKRGRAIITEQT